MSMLKFYFFCFLLFFGKKNIKSDTLIIDGSHILLLHIIDGSYILLNLHVSIFFFFPLCAVLSLILQNIALL